MFVRSARGPRSRRRRRWRSWSTRTARSRTASATGTPTGACGRAPCCPPATDRAPWTSLTDMRATETFTCFVADIFFGTENVLVVRGVRNFYNWERFSWFVTWHSVVRRPSRSRRVRERYTDFFVTT